jgi:NAD(P)-dependent dehydrogenase (short-subunit alcohol dehydrogenase family)
VQQFEGRVAVVTGAASGIGRALVNRFVDEKMRVVLADVEVGPLREAEAELLDSHADVLAIQTDVRRLESVEALHQRVIDAYGEVNVLCNNAGVAVTGVTWEQSTADWDWALGVNLLGAVNAIRTFLPGMIAHGHEGHIVNTASLGGLAATPFQGAYSVSKFAVVGLSENLFMDLKATGARIGVSVLCPGFVNTRIMDCARNRPVEYGAPAASDPNDPAVQALRQMMAAGMDPAAVAECAVAAIRADRLYVLTHPEWDDAIRDRTDAMLSGRNPGLPGL